MALTLPTVPATVFVNGVSEINADDLNDYRTFMAAVKAYLETAEFEGLHIFVDGLEAAEDENITVSGTGEFKHGDKEIVFSTIGGIGGSGLGDDEGDVWPWDTIRGARQGENSGSTLVVGLQIPRGIRIRRIDAEVAVDGTNSRDLELWRSGIGALDSPAQVAVSSSILNGSYTHSITGIDHTVNDDESYWVKWTTPIGSLTDNYWKSVKLTYDRP